MNIRLRAYRQGEGIPERWCYTWKSSVTISFGFTLFFTTNRFWEAERRDLAGAYWTIRSDKYFGDLPLIHLKVNMIILNSMRYLIGSQCISLRTCVIWSYLLHNETRRAAEFWILCSLAMSLLGIPMRRILQLSRIEEIKACTWISVDDLLKVPTEGF